MYIIYIHDAFFRTSNHKHISISLQIDLLQPRRPWKNEQLQQRLQRMENHHHCRQVKKKSYPSESESFIHSFVDTCIKHKITNRKSTRIHRQREYINIGLVWYVFVLCGMCCIKYQKFNKIVLFIFFSRFYFFNDICILRRHFACL